MISLSFFLSRFGGETEDTRLCSTYFAIDSVTGEITVLDQRVLDREEIVGRTESDVLECFVGFDLENGGERHDIVNIEILDVNDCIPEFFGLLQPHTIEVTENVALPTPLKLLQPTDLDKGINGTTSFNITSGNEDGFFIIDLAEGDTVDSTTNRVLFLIRSLDFDSLPNNGIFNLTITITDMGAEPLLLEQRINIQVTNVEDEPPTFETTSYNFNITENHPVGSVFARVRAASDQSSGQVSYRSTGNSLFGNAYDFFGVNQITGELFLRQPIDYESLQAPRRFSFEIGASNPNTGQTLTVVVTVEVLDVNEHPPFFRCRSRSDRYVQSSYSCDGKSVDNSVLYIEENVTTFPSNLFVFHVTDDDQTTDFSAINRTSIGYQIVPEDDRFVVGFTHFNTIDLALAQINGTFDRERTPNFSVILTVENLAHPTLRTDTTITVRVLDINDNVPEFSQSEYQGSVFEGSPEGMEVLRVQAHDPDEGENGTITYFISSVSEEVAQDWFQISPVNGAITVNNTASLDYLSLGGRGVLTLNVTASDNGSQLRMSSYALAVISILPSATFISGSYQEYSSNEFNLLASSNDSFYLEFRSSERSGLLAYQLGSNEAVFSMEIEGGSIVARLEESVMRYDDSDVSNDVWHSVRMQWTNNQVCTTK